MRFYRKNVYKRLLNVYYNYAKIKRYTNKPLPMYLMSTPVCFRRSSRQHSLLRY